MSRKGKRIDYLGALLLTVSLVALLLALIWGGTQYPWSSAVILGLFGVALLGLVFFVLVERRAEDPVLPACSEEVHR